jgi:CheY-like chemotaxis protein
VPILIDGMAGCTTTKWRNPPPSNGGMCDFAIPVLVQQSTRLRQLDQLSDPPVTIRLLIADDHEIVRDGLRLMFEGSDVEIVVESVDGQQAFDALGRHVVDVAIVDISMPRADGYRFLELVRAAGIGTPVIMHSVHDGSEYIRRCRDLGAKGFVLKGQDRGVLLSAVRAAHAGHEFWAGPDSH